MYNIQTVKADSPQIANLKSEIADFLFQHLEEYRDPVEDILKCLDYALGNQTPYSGHVFLARDAENAGIRGAVVVNHTHMKGFIPENILVYIAVDKNTRGTGLGTRLMQYAIENVEGSIALHVEPHNPAKKLYEKLGFQNKYLEMRLTR